MNQTFRIVTAALFCVGLSACASHKQKPQAPEPSHDGGSMPQETHTEGKFGPSDLDTNSCLRQRTVYFDFAKSEIKPEFQAQMACHAKYLRARPEARISLEGNADERGTREYNLGLGERRGNAVQSALISAGGGSNQLNVVSYGEERPVCKEHGEGCWGKNRRVEIVYTSK